MWKNHNSKSNNVMSQYANGFQVNLNEVCILDFRENTQDGVTSVAKIAILYSFLKDLHNTLGEAIEQHDKKLGELQRTKANMN